MKTKIAILILTLFAAITNSFAQTATKKNGSLLWKISGKDLSKPSYILGTFHLKPAEFLDSIPGAKAALLSAEQVIGELALSDMSNLQLQTQQSMMMPSDTTYQLLYSEDDYQFVSNRLAAKIGAGLDQFGIITPAGINLIYVMMMYQKYFPGENPDDMIDITVQNIAIENNKPVLGLETVDEQINALFSSPLKRQAEILLCTLKNEEYLISTVKPTVEAYNQFDLDRLYKISLDDNDPCPYSREEVDLLNKNRNENWMKILPGMMKKKSSFIAVGALHLPGEEGLLNQLKKLGYTVEPVR